MFNLVEYSDIAIPTSGQVLLFKLLFKGFFPALMEWPQLTSVFCVRLNAVPPAFCCDSILEWL